MLVAIVFSALVLSCGYAILRPAGLAKGPIGLALLAPAGIGVLAVLSTWLAFVHVAPPSAGVCALALGLVGVGFVVLDRATLRQAAVSLVREQRGAALTLALALVVPALAMGIAFAGVQVPLSPRDGAYHTEATHALRYGRPWADWYPLGTAATFAAVLQLLPWLDTAQGTFDLGVTFALLAPLVVFGLGVAVWRSLPMASAGALLMGVTYLYPYFPEMWSGWPLLLSLLLAVGLWIAALEYIERPRWRWAALGGLLLGSTVVVHGSELYTSAIVLLVLAVANRRRLDWRALPRHLGLATLIGVVLAAPYLPTLFHWAGTGGAYSAGSTDGTALEGGAATSVGASLWLTFFVQALGIDLPVRLVLLGVGVWWAVRQRVGLSLVSAGAVFLCISLMFTFLNGLAGVRWLYAITFPWGMHYRVLMLVELVQVLLAGAGFVVLGRLLAARLASWPGWNAAVPSAGLRRLRRLGRLLVVTWFLLAFWSLTYSLTIPTELVLGFTDDDAAAMQWLRANAMPGEVVVNDGYADAGIWAPYKAGVPILISRLGGDQADARARVFANVARLDQVPEAVAAACALHVRYVYYGARESQWDRRQFPPPGELRASSALEEVFSSGDAVVFRLRPGC